MNMYDGMNSKFEKLNFFSLLNIGRDSLISIAMKEFILLEPLRSDLC